jgi:hypothetical protein
VALVKTMDRPVPLDWEYAEKPLHETLLAQLESTQDAHLRGALRAARCLRARARPDEHRLPLEGRQGRHQAGAHRLPLGHALRRGVAPLRAPRRGRAPRGHAAQVPARGGAAGRQGAAQDHLRHGHARRGREHPAAHGGVHQALQVRRRQDQDPDGARLPPDRGARRPKGLRHAGHRHRAGAGARHREQDCAAEGRGRREEAAQVEAQQAARAGLCALGRADLPEAARRRARAPRVALRGLARDDAQRLHAPGRLHCHEAPHPREPRRPGAAASARAPRARHPALADQGGHRGAARGRGGPQRRPADRLLAQPGALALRGGGRREALDRENGGLRAQLGVAGGGHARGPERRALQAGGHRSRGARWRRSNRRAWSTTNAWPSSRRSRRPSQTPSSCWARSACSPSTTRGWAATRCASSRWRATCSSKARPSTATCAPMAWRAPRVCCCVTSRTSTRRSSRPSRRTRRPTSSTTSSSGWGWSSARWTAASWPSGSA